ncbi:MAG TPA: response regulator [Phycisphaerae bacterium]|nr:response regulator [Phycisphaerae bacterium]
MNILLVDASRTIRNIQKNVLVQLGYADVAEASNGVEALKFMAESKPDLVLMTWNMPNMDGITFVRKVRETDKTTPMIMVTAEAGKRRVIEAIQAGVNNYVVKPFTADTLGEKINATLAKAGIAGTRT